MTDTKYFNFKKIKSGYSILLYIGKDENVVIPDTYEGEPVIEIGGFAFREYESSAVNIKSVVLPETIQRIKFQAFSNCKALCNINIPNSVVEIDEYAFIHCVSLTEINIPNGVSKIMARTFENCTNLRKITCDNQDIICSKLAFRYCKSIEELPMFIWQQIDLPLQLSCKISENFILIYETLDADLQDELVTYLKRRKRIRDYLFTVNNSTIANFLITKLTKLKLDQINDYLEENIKLNNTICTAVLLEYKNKTFTKKQITDYNENKEDVEIGFELPTLAQFKKKWVARINVDYVQIVGYKGDNTSEIIPSALKNGMPISCNVLDFLVSNKRAFREKLEYITFPNGEMLYLNPCDFHKSTVKEIVVPNGEPSIIRERFMGLDFIEKIVLPETVRIIERSAFENCKSLKEINFPSSLTEIGSRAFYGCENLKDVVFTPKKSESSDKVFETVALKTVGEDAFSYTAIEEITFPICLESIHTFPFKGCKNLKRVYVSPNLITKKAKHYKDCPNLEFVGVNGSDNVLDKININKE